MCLYKEVWSYSLKEGYINLFTKMIESFLRNSLRNESGDKSNDLDVLFSHKACGLKVHEK
jgi:hypothetical protein